MRVCFLYPYLQRLILFIIVGFFTIMLVLAACDMFGILGRILCLPCYGCCAGLDYVRKKKQERAWLDESGITIAQTTRVAQCSEDLMKPGLLIGFKDWCKTRRWNLLDTLRRLRLRDRGSQERRLEAGWPSDSTLPLPPYTSSTCGIAAPPYEVAVAQTQNLTPYTTRFPDDITYEPTCMVLPPTLRTPMLTVPSPTHASPTRTSHRASSLYHDGSDISSTSYSSLFSSRSVMRRDRR